jgi:hypothetical protein
MSKASLPQECKSSFSNILCPLLACAFVFIGRFLIAGSSEATQFFQDHSTWYEKIHVNPKIMTNSEDYINDIKINGTAISIEHREWSVPIWFAKADTPVVTMTVNRQNPITQGWNVVPIPPEAKPAGNEAALAGQYRDGHMVVVSPSWQYAWDFFGARKDPTGNWSAVNVRQWDLSGDGLNSPYDRLGSARACPMPLLHGIITYEEIQKGYIDHALAFAYWGAKKQDHWGVYPCEAYRRDISDRQWAMVHGFRLQLDPALDINSLGLNRAGKIIARAMQEYGMIFVENSGAGSNIIYAESLDGKSESWSGILGSLTGIPLDKFRVIEPIYP